MGEPLGLLLLYILMFFPWKITKVYSFCFNPGIVGGLSTISACAPSDKFLSWGAPLGIGLGAVFAASIGSAFLPPTTALGMSLYSLSLYGGLILFSGFLLYDTQKVNYLIFIFKNYSTKFNFLYIIIDNSNYRYGFETISTA